MTLHAATTTIGPGGNLQLAFNNASDGDTIIIQGGTYQLLTADPFFHIDRDITVSTDVGPVTLQAPPVRPSAWLYVAVEFPLPEP